MSEIDGQKIKRVLIVIELENGKSIIAAPTGVGKVEGQKTLIELQQSLSNKENDDTRFLSPFVFAVELQTAAREWVKELEKVKFPGDYYLVRHNPEEGETPNIDIYLDEGYESSDIGGAIKWIKHFFNLGE